jgi:hypothetical protein
MPSSLFELTKHAYITSRAAARLQVHERGAYFTAMQPNEMTGTVRLRQGLLAWRKERDIDSIREAGVQHGTGISHLHVAHPIYRAIFL